MTELKIGVMAAVMVAATGLLRAQGTPATPAPEAASPTPAATAGSPAAPAAEAYTYDPAGRRDPFVSLLSRGLEPETGKKVTGLGSLTTGEVMLRGVMQSRNSYVALLSGPDGKTYSARANDRLVDGVIRSVTPQGIVIMQEVNDPLSLVKQREVRKGLRTAEDGK
jgi:type IV pilus assembly protein PilP